MAFHSDLNKLATSNCLATDLTLYKGSLGLALMSKEGLAKVTDAGTYHEVQTLALTLLFSYNLFSYNLFYYNLVSSLLL